LALVKTPISYPGGKSRAIKNLEEIIQGLSFDTYVEAFLGGGSFALYLTQTRPGLKVVVNDAFQPLSAFWSILQSNPEELTSSLEEALSSCTDEKGRRDKYRKSHEIMRDENASDLDLAVAFYIGNKMAYGGLMRGDNFSEFNSRKKFTQVAISKLHPCSEVIQDWEIRKEDYKTVVEDHLSDNVLVYLDPPYQIKHSKLYGNDGKMHQLFCHDNFRDKCNEWKESGSKILISYNQEMKANFPHWNEVVFPLWYSMQTNINYQNSQSSRWELCLTNF
jgi:DNA adenine methylase Dam